MLPALLQALRLAIFSQGYPKINPRPRDPGTPPLLLTLNVAKKCGPLLFIYDLPCVRRPLWREILVDQGIQKRCIFDPPADAPPGYHQHGPRLLLAGNIVVRRVSFDWACKPSHLVPLRGAARSKWASRKQHGAHHQVSGNVCMHHNAGQALQQGATILGIIRRAPSTLFGKLFGHLRRPSSQKKT